MKTKIIAALLAVLAVVMVIVIVPTAADTETTTVPTILIGSKKVAAEAGKTVSVEVSIVNNPGVVTMTIPVTWDTEVLKLTGITNSFTILSETYTDCNGWLGSEDYDTAQTNGVYYLAWDNDLAEADFTGDGALCTMTFEVLKNFETTAITPVMESDDELKILPIANIMNYDMDDLQTGFNYTAGVLEAGGEEEKTVTVKGTVTSFGSAEDKVTVELFAEGNETAAYSTTVDCDENNSASYEIAGVKPGNYTVKISKPNHVSRTYQITVNAQ